VRSSVGVTGQRWAVRHQAQTGCVQVSSSTPVVNDANTCEPCHCRTAQPECQCTAHVYMHSLRCEQRTRRYLLTPTMTSLPESMRPCLRVAASSILSLARPLSMYLQRNHNECTHTCTHTRGHSTQQQRVVSRRDGAAVQLLALHTRPTPARPLRTRCTENNARLRVRHCTTAQAGSLSRVCWCSLGHAAGCVGLLDDIHGSLDELLRQLLHHVTATPGVGHTADLRLLLDDL
jgi:hypothetical protein